MIRHKIIYAFSLRDSFYPLLFVLTSSFPYRLTLGLKVHPGGVALSRMDFLMSISRPASESLS